MPWNHATFRSHVWTVTKWDDSIGLPTGGKGFIQKMEDIMNETDTKPLDLYVGFNIITNVGLTESSKRDTNDSPQNTTGVQYIQTGTSAVSEDVSVTALGAAHGSRQDIDSIGERVTVNQTSKYGATLNDTHITAGTTVNECALFNAVTSGIMHAYLVFPDKTLNSGERIVFQINELQKNGA